eukprot:970116-Pyramimonas_sp.AAC.1
MPHFGVPTLVPDPRLAVSRPMKDLGPRHVGVVVAPPLLELRLPPPAGAHRAVPRVRQLLVVSVEHHVHGRLRAELVDLALRVLTQPVTHLAREAQVAPLGEVRHEDARVEVLLPRGESDGGKCGEGWGRGGRTQREGGRIWLQSDSAGGPTVGGLDTSADQFRPAGLKRFAVTNTSPCERSSRHLRLARRCGLRE